MPIPKRKAGEPRDEFVSRCIAEIRDEYDVKQASAICYAQLHESFDKEKYTESTRGEMDAL